MLQTFFLFIDYFKKQGFSEYVRITKKICYDYIKHYQGAILMHCELNPKIIYTQFTSILRLQKEVNFFTSLINICY